MKIFGFYGFIALLLFIALILSVIPNALAHNSDKMSKTEALQTTSGESVNAPVAYWKFNEHRGSIAIDSSNHGNTARIRGATWQSTSECVLGASCLSFDGYDDFVNAHNSPYLRISHDITVSAWIKKADMSDGAEVCIGKYGMTNDRGWILVYDTDGRVRFDGRDGSGNYRTSIGPVLDDNTWHFVTGERKGSIWKIYVDGALAAQNDVGTTGSINSWNDNLYIGKDSEPLGYYCNATIDDVRIYNFALSDIQVQTLYERGL